MIYCTVNSENLEFESVKKISEFIGVSTQTIRNILSGKTKFNPCNIRYEVDNGIIAVSSFVPAKNCEVISLETLSDIVASCGN